MREPGREDLAAQARGTGRTSVKGRGRLIVAAASGGDSGDGFRRRLGLLVSRHAPFKIVYFSHLQKTLALDLLKPLIVCRREISQDLFSSRFFLRVRFTTFLLVISVTPLSHLKWTGTGVVGVLGLPT